MVRVGTFAIDKPLILWINDGLMGFFFLLIALELKREILEGQLSTPLAIATPGFAALGGMAAPALIYTAFNIGDPVAMRGWAIGDAAGMADGNARVLYDKLEQVVLPLYFSEDRSGWIRVMKGAINKNASYFNSHRMMRRYATEAYAR